jgi:hypothetical protein
MRCYEEAVNLMAEVTEYSDDDFVLDVGCGPGNILNLIDVEFKLGLDPPVSHFSGQGFAKRPFQAAAGFVKMFLSNKAHLIKYFALMFWIMLLTQKSSS